MKTELEIRLKQATGLLERISSLPFIFPSPYDPTLEQEIGDFFESSSESTAEEE